MNILGISCHYHESAASLIRDGKVVAAIAEERLSRIKHDPGFPKLAIDTCLAIGNIRPRDIDYAVFYEKPFVKFRRNIEIGISYFPRSRQFFAESIRNSLSEKLWVTATIADYLKIPHDRVLTVPHHTSHAAAAFYPSPFQRAAVLTLDGVGERTTGMVGRADGNKIYPVKELRFPHSVGLLYSAFTAYLGFAVNDGEYKVMGMAGYGKPKYAAKVKKLFRVKEGGAIELDLRYFSFHTTADRMYTDKFINLFRGANRFDIAASVQHVTEEIVLGIIRNVQKETGETNLVYGGGVALNSVINAAITNKTAFKKAFIFPAAGDDGGSVGCALYVYHHVLGKKKRYPLTEVFWGQAYKPERTLRKKRIPYKKYSNRDLYAFITDQLVAGKVVGWFEGRSEFGPRALGHRSILADPKNPKMKEIVNSKIKFREEFRPFAPVVLAERAKKYFSGINPFLTPYMLGTFKASELAKKHAAAAVHVDGSSRIQTVGRTYSGRYSRLLSAFYKKTGRAILLNTSFNLKGEPIVETPENALATFMKSGIDVLVIENCVIVKERK